MRRSLTALLTVAVVLLAANLIAVLARPAQAQVAYPVKPVPHVIGITGDNFGPFLFRAWSDGTVDANDYRDINTTYGGEELWKGWKVVK